MRFLVKNCLLAIIWTLMTERFSVGNLIFGFLLSWLLLLYLNPEEELDVPFPNPWNLLTFVLFFLWELILANLRVAYYVLSPVKNLKPGIVKIPLEAETGLEITLLANTITLTPGSMTIDVSEDGKHLYLHVMHMDDPEQFKKEIKEGFEKRILQLLR